MNSTRVSPISADQSWLHCTGLSRIIGRDDPTTGSGGRGTTTAGGGVGAGGRGQIGVPIAWPGVPEWSGTGRACGSAGTPMGDGT